MAAEPGRVRRIGNPARAADDPEGRVTGGKRVRDQALVGPDELDVQRAQEAVAQRKLARLQVDGRQGPGIDRFAVCGGFLCGIVTGEYQSRERRRGPTRNRRERRPSP